MIEVHSDPYAGIHLTPFGDLDWTGTKSLRHVLHDLLRPGIHLAIDMSYVEFVDAVGVSALVGCIRRVRAVGGDVELLNPRSQVQRLLELLGVYWLLEYPSSTSGNDAA
jgi:anti-anti-sigma factor